VVDEKKEEAVEEFNIVEQPGAGIASDDTDGPRVEDERLRNDEDDEDEDNSSSGTDETPEERAARRRDERKKRRERQRKAEFENKQSLQRANEQIDFMASKMQQMEALHLRNEARAVEERMAYARDTYSRAERAHAEAIARGDGIGASNALRVRDQAAEEYRQSQNLQGRLMSIGQAPQTQQQPRGPDPRVVQRARSFVEKHPWIDPSGMKDEDSAVARALDMKLQADGYDPSADEYWDILEKTLEKRLPHRFKNGGRSGPPTLGGNDRAGSGKRTFYLSPDRKKAMQDAGIWDDPVARNKMIKSYATYDAQQKSTAAR
jgi:hypothetical protein